MPSGVIWSPNRENTFLDSHFVSRVQHTRGVQKSCIWPPTGQTRAPPGRVVAGPWAPALPFLDGLDPFSDRFSLQASALRCDIINIGKCLALGVENTN